MMELTAIASMQGRQAECFTEMVLGASRGLAWLWRDYDLGSIGLFS